MLNFLNKLLPFRNVFLTVLIVLLFVNWYYYKPLYDKLRLLGNYPLLEHTLVPLLGYEATQFIIVKGVIFWGLAAFNSSLSLAIIFFYFKGNLIIIIMAAKILFLFCFSIIGLEILFFILGNGFLFTNTRYAMDLIPSPLVEALLIPLMKLYQQSLNQKD